MTDPKGLADRLRSTAPPPAEHAVLVDERVLQEAARALRQEPSVEALLGFVDEMLHGYGVNHTSKFVRAKAQAIAALYRVGT